MREFVTSQIVEIVIMQRRSCISPSGGGWGGRGQGAGVGVRRGVWSAS